LNDTIDFLLHNCEYGCLNGICKPHQENVTNATETAAVGQPPSQNAAVTTAIEPDKTSGPLIMPETKDNESGQNEYVCMGCELDKKCYPFGYRNGLEFCSENGNFTAQLETGKSCQNDFECQSNVCVSGKCISENLLQLVMRWLSSLFGFG